MKQQCFTSDYLTNGEAINGCFFRSFGEFTVSPRDALSRARPSQNLRTSWIEGDAVAEPFQMLDGASCQGAIFHILLIISEGGPVDF